MFCTKCGTQIPDGAVFCVNCGMKPEEPAEDGGVQADRTRDSVFAGKRKRLSPAVVIIPAVVIALCAGLYFQNVKKARANAEIHFSLGKELLEKEDITNAEKEFSEAIKLNPKKAEYYIFRSRTYSGSYWLDKAIADMSIAVKVEPKNAEARKWRGLFYAIKGEHDRAVSDYNAWIALTAGDKAENSAAYAARGSVYNSELEFSKAIEDYSKAIELNPRNFGAYVSRAYVYSRIDEYGKSVEDWTFLINNDGQNAASNYNNRAFMYFYTGRYGEALADINKAISIDPDAHFYDTRGTIYRAMGNYDGAISDYSEAIRLSPGKAIFWMNRSLAYLWKNNDVAAMNADQSTALRISARISARDAAEAYVDIAINWANAGYYEDAIRMYDNALSLDPDNKNILRRKAETEEKARQGRI